MTCHTCTPDRYRLCQIQLCSPIMLLCCILCSQLDKVLGSGNPVIIIVKYQNIQTSFAFVIAPKSASSSTYQLWSPSTFFNPNQVWQSFNYDNISIMAFPRSGPPEWVTSHWGGGLDTMLC